MDELQAESCPKCSKAHFKILYSESTSMGLENSIVQDGNLIVPPDPNIRTFHCECLECECKFDVKVQYRKAISNEERNPNAVEINN